MKIYSKRKLLFAYIKDLNKQKWLVLLLSMLLTGFSHGQIITGAKINKDTVQQLGKAEGFRIFAEEQLNENKRKLTDKQNIAIQRQKYLKLRKAAKETKDYFNKGIDTNSIVEEISYLENLYKLSTNDIIKRESGFYSLRNLTTSQLLLVELLHKLESLNNPLSAYKEAIENKRKVIDSLLIDSALFFLPTDTTLYSDYEKGYLLLLKDLAPADSMLNSSNASVMHLEDRAAKLREDIFLNIIKIETYRKNVSLSLFEKEIPVIYNTVNTDRPLSEIIAFSSFKAFTIVGFFLENNTGILALIFVLFLFTFYLFSVLRQRVLATNAIPGLHPYNEIVSYPFLSALFVVLNIGQFFFTFPPFAVQAIVWLLLSLTFLILHRKDTDIFGKGFWLYLLLLFVLSIADNLILEVSVFEKWFLFFSSLASILIAINYFRKNKKSQSGMSLTNGVLILFLLLETIAFIAIVFGRYNLSKTVFTAGYYAIASAIFLYWTYQFLIMALNTYFNTLDSKNIQNVFTKLKLMHEKSPAWFSTFFVFGWIILFIRNFYFYSVLIAQANEFLYHERTIGKYSFTLESIFIFSLVLFLTGLISRLLSLLTNSSDQDATSPIQKKGGISNWLLLIRLATIIIGVLLAFAAAGIPMDRLTIIIGSLGIGIGFGLQNIVSNLISGVILAFERPVEIGDQIEVAGKVGRVKEIGIRSSKMVNLDGAEVIIPNGDLLNQHMINWTLTNNIRRVELIVGVKYGTDLYKTKQLLEHILLSNNRIEQIPAPTVLLHMLNSSSIDFRLLFWSDINIWTDLKSEIILGIDQSFKEAGIEIPYPQQDVYIRELPELNPRERK